jgi:hypothetical protein
MATSTTNLSLSPPQATGQDTSPSGLRQTGVAKSQLQTDLINSAKGGGKRKHKKYYAKGGKIEVNTIQPVYTDTAGGNQSATSQQVGNQALFAKATEQATTDKAAASVPMPASTVQSGGDTRVLKAGQPWNSCYSGGKKSKSKKSKKASKSKNSKKSKKSKKAKKTKKSRKSKK